MSNQKPNGKMLNASICVSDISELYKQGHSGFMKAKNGKVYASLTVWVNETEDQYGQSGSVQLNPTLDGKGKREYVGNIRKPKPKQAEPTGQGTTQQAQFGTPVVVPTETKVTLTSDELPF